METKFKKIYALIPEQLWLQLRDVGKFNPSFDSWIAKIISDALRKEASR